MHEMVLEILLILVAMIQILIPCLNYLSRDMRQRLRMEAVEHITSELKDTILIKPSKMEVAPQGCLQITNKKTTNKIN